MISRFLNIKTIFVLILICLTGLAGFLFYRYQQTQKELDQLKSNNAQAEVEKTLDEVSQLMVLPQNETPTVATVTDVEKLKGTQPFFANAKNGDKLILYSQKAILYDPVAKKIVEIAPTAIDQKSLGPSSTPNPTSLSPSSAPSVSTAPTN